MKILHINTNDRGGAAKASLRLHFELINQGIESNYLVLDKHFNYPNVEEFNRDKSKSGIISHLVRRHTIPSFYQILYRNRIKTDEHFSVLNSWFDITSHHLYRECDIVHLHYISEFVNIPNFFRNNTKPLVWTFHDMFPLNGLLHIYNEEEIRNSKFTYQKVLQKQKILRESIADSNITVVVPTDWLRKAVIDTEIYKGKNIKTINHGIDVNFFSPIDKTEARKILSLPIKSKIILLTTENFERKNKNIAAAIDAITKLNNENLTLLTVGSNFDAQKFKLKYPHINRGFVYDELVMKLYYSAADLTIVPSLIETFSLVTLESLSCGTPVAAFKTTGPAEIIIHKSTGWLAEPFNNQDLTAGINYILSNNLSENARKHAVNNFDIYHKAKEYQKVYEG